eukprot:TRINITY_DN44756_c0_g1_i1.p1 TRINITY_DN44756_c0_g1~~TRINITY_DN44756_c0_g1_i1.p1  ORF type:complete len:985 (+),score=172.28 TRINITY_DN44756_c0_g1_i1:63-3017(+)
MALPRDTELLDAETRDGLDAPDDFGTGSNRYKIVVRVRPATRQLASSFEGEDPTVVDVLTDTRLRVHRPDQEPIDLQVDRVLSSDSNQGDAYRSVRNIVAGVVDGVNGTIFAYGQTGSGKTYTMTGEAATVIKTTSDPRVVKQALHAHERGLIPRALEHLFKHLAAAATGPSSVRAYVSFMEIYAERVFDLLVAPRPTTTGMEAFSVRTNSVSGVGTGAAKSASSRRALAGGLEILEGKGGSVSVPGLTVVEVKSLDQALEVLRIGTASRTSGDNGFNENSSRSHAIFQVLLERRCHSGRDGAKRSTCKVSKLNLVDLAGSEKLRPDSTAVGTTLQELTCINLSLSTLGQCIAALVDQRRTHVPYRDSKLTRLLQDALRGRSLTAMFVCISPCMSALEETLSSLKFADRAKKAVLDHDPFLSSLAGAQGGPADRRVEELQAQVRELAHKLQLERQARHHLESVLATRSDSPSPRVRRASSSGQACIAPAADDVVESDSVSEYSEGATELSGSRVSSRTQGNRRKTSVSACLDRLSRQNEELMARLDALEGRCSSTPSTPSLGGLPRRKASSSCSSSTGTGPVPGRSQRLLAALEQLRAAEMERDAAEADMPASEVEADQDLDTPSEGQPLQQLPSSSKLLATSSESPKSGWSSSGAMQADNSADTEGGPESSYPAEAEEVETSNSPKTDELSPSNHDLPDDRGSTVLELTGPSRAELSCKGPAMFDSPLSDLPVPSRVELSCNGPAMLDSPLSNLPVAQKEESSEEWLDMHASLMNNPWARSNSRDMRSPRERRAAAAANNVQGACSSVETVVAARCSPQRQRPKNSVPPEDLHRTSATTARSSQLASSMASRSTPSRPTLVSARKELLSRAREDSARIRAAQRQAAREGSTVGSTPAGTSAASGMSQASRPRPKTSRNENSKSPLKATPKAEAHGSEPATAHTPPEARNSKMSKATPFTPRDIAAQCWLEFEDELRLAKLPGE